MNTSIFIILYFLFNITTAKSSLHALLTNAMQLFNHKLFQVDLIVTSPLDGFPPDINNVVRVASSQV